MCCPSNSISFPLFLHLFRLVFAKTTRPSSGFAKIAKLKCAKLQASYFAITYLKLYMGSAMTFLYNIDTSNVKLKLIATPRIPMM